MCAYQLWRHFSARDCAWCRDGELHMVHWLTQCSAALFLQSTSDWHCAIQTTIASPEASQQTPQFWLYWYTSGHVPVPNLTVSIDRHRCMCCTYMHVIARPLITCTIKWGIVIFYKLKFTQVKFGHTVYWWFCLKTAKVVSCQISSYTVSGHNNVALGMNSFVNHHTPWPVQ